MTYQMVIGIEHLMTGILFDANAALQFNRNSASTFRITSSEPFNSYWLPRQIFLSAIEITESENSAPEPRCSVGEVEWYAQVMAQAMAFAEGKAAQTNEGQQVPYPVLRGLMRKFGVEAGTWVKQLRYSHMGCWMFNWCGMVLGVEKNGDIHS